MKLIETIKNILSEQKFKIGSIKPQEFPSDYLGKGGEFERVQRQNQRYGLKNPLQITTFTDNAIKLIKKYESFKNKQYLCPSKKWTIGYGTRLDFHPELKNKTITESKAIELLKADLKKNVVPAILKYVKVPLKQNQFDALVSLIYNIGRSRFVNSKLLNDINSGKIKSLKKNWSEFRKSEGQVSNGLINRREEELNLFFI